MALRFDNVPNNLFEHSKEFETGVGKERVGLGEVIVSLDGSGDFDKLSSAIKSLPSGGSIFIKSGIYSTDQETIIPANGTTIRGNGRDTIIYNNFILNNKQNIILKDFTLFSADWTDAPIVIEGATNITIQNINFKLSKNAYYLIFNESTSTHLIFERCTLDKNSKTIDAALGTALTKSIIINNYMPDTTMLYLNELVFTNNNILGNIFYNIQFDAGGDYNTCIGNQTDIAIVNGGTGNEIAHNCLF